MGWCTSTTSEITKKCIKVTNGLVNSLGVWWFFSYGQEYTSTSNCISL